LGLTFFLFTKCVAYLNFFSRIFRVFDTKCEGSIF
jgi:hypothetical protein